MGTFSNAGRPRGRDRGHRACGGPVRPVFNSEDSGGGWGHKPDYKTAALCKQVRRILSLTLSGECGDPVLQELIVDDVLPAPNAGRLLVRVMLRARADGPTLTDTLQRLAGVERMLRARVGEAIARKRTPELAFNVVPLPPGANLQDGSLESEVPHE